MVCMFILYPSPHHLSPCIFPCTAVPFSKSSHGCHYTHIAKLHNALHLVSNKSSFVWASSSYCRIQPISGNNAIVFWGDLKILCK